MIIVHKSISLDELKKMSENMYGDLVKTVVDIEQEIMAVDSELHSDEEALLLANGSKQEHLWGINIYPDNVEGENFIEFDSMINLRPSQDNKSRSVESKQIQEKIISIVRKIVQ